MLLPLRHELIGRYHTPRFRIGDTLQCAIRGPIRVVKVSDGLIPWPIGRAEGSRALSYVICGDLEMALSVEAGTAIAHWWDVRRMTVSRWRKSLELTEPTEGELRLRRAYGNEPEALVARHAGQLAKPRQNYRHSKATRRKISKAHKGVPLSESHRQRIGEGQKGRMHSEESRRLISEAAKGRKRAKR